MSWLLWPNRSFSVVQISLCTVAFPTREVTFKTFYFTSYGIEFQLFTKGFLYFRGEAKQSLLTKILVEIYVENYESKILLPAYIGVISFDYRVFRYLFFMCTASSLYQL